MAEDSIASVETWDLIKTTEWLEENNVSFKGIQTLEHLRDLVRATMDNTHKKHSEVYHKLHSEMDNILAKSIHMKEEIVRIYDSLLTFFERTLPVDIKTIIQKHYGMDIHQKISENKEKLLNKTCTIVVTGETSAGKSSFLNLLLGENVLPSSLLCSTRRTCEIHSIPTGSPCYFVVTMDDGSSKLHNEYYGNKENMIKDLEECVTSKDTSLRKVDIYWHVPLLGDNTHVTLVDSPGIGDNQKLSDELLNYLPDASALIFVIDSSNCGGIQDDKLGRIFSRFNSEIKDRNLFSFDPKCTMFILNKWDKLEKKIDEPDLEDAVWQNTLEKLTENLTGYSWETCMYKMSIDDAIKYRDCGMVSEKYRCMLTGLKQFVSSSLSVNARTHCRWLTQLHEDINMYLKIRLDDAKSNYEENDKKYNHASFCLSKLHKHPDCIRDDLELKCTKTCNELATKMHDHLHSLDVQAQLKRRIYIGKVKEEEIMKNKVLKQIKNLIEEEVIDLEKREQIIAKARDQLRREIHENYHILIDNLVDFEKSITNNKSEEELELSIGEKVLLRTIGIPVGIVPGTALMPIIIPAVAIKELVKKTKTTTKTPDELKDTYLNSALHNLNKDACKQYVDNKYSPQFKTMFDHISKEIPRKIKGLERLVKDKKKQRLISKEVKELYEPAIESVRIMLFELYRFNLTHISEYNIDVERVKVTRNISTSDSLIVHAARLCSDDEESEVVIKVLPDAPTKTYMKTVAVLSMLRKNDHKNVVCFIGFCYTDCMPAIESKDGISTTLQFSSPRMLAVFEMCDETLEDYVLQHKDIQCGNPNKTNQKRALQFFCTTAQSICEEMLYMHDQGHLLRFIKMNNVMMKDEQVKINPPMISSLSNNQREWPTAPELANGQYTKETDVFYFGNLLWELWYGRKASEHTCSSTEVDRRLPDLSSTHAMPEKLAQIVRQCWDTDPKQRPSLGDVISVLICLKLHGRC
ncbi:hypothetical protein DPMN_040801 [Dreissena polymorpha]|uniref:Protein kinase domain-containing protein n=1 Tax=Dreissena polymorpha TaxID=45954 RepID=A0A9D4HVD7_DREPO|nr:hypothetical protein DPMN_040801 [Dreissena polymorpha]